MRARRLPWLRIAIATIVVTLLVVYLRRLDWDAILRSTEHASVGLLLVGTIGNIPLIWVKALRMRLLVARRVGTVRLMGFYVASYAADNLVMSQAGLGLRVALLRREGLTLTTAVSTQALEKILEGIGLALLCVPLLATHGLDPRLETSLRWCLIAGGIGVAVVLALSLVVRREMRWVRRLAETAAALRDPALAASVLALTMIAWAIELGMVAVTMVALGLPVTTIAAPVLVLLAVNLAALVPGLPANVGAFEMAAVVALATFGVAREPALGFAILYHALHTIPVTAVGLFGLHRATRARADSDLGPRASGLGRQPDLEPEA